MTLIDIAPMFITACLTMGGSVVAQESAPFLDVSEGMADVEESSSELEAKQYEAGLALMQGWRFVEAEAVFLTILEATPDSEMENNVNARLSEIAGYRVEYPGAEREGEPVAAPVAPVYTGEVNTEGRKYGTLLGVGLGIPLGLIGGGVGGVAIADYKVSNTDFCPDLDGYCWGSGIVIMVMYGIGLVGGAAIGAATGGVVGGAVGRHQGGRIPIEEEKQSLRITPTVNFDKDKVASYGFQASFRF